MLRPISQQGQNDCGIAALATLLTLDYPGVCDAMIQELGGLPRSGLTTPQMKRVAHRLGIQLAHRPKGRWDPADPEVREFAGIIKVSGDGAGKQWRHWTVLWKDLVFDTDGIVWPLHSYLIVRQAALGARLSIGRYLPCGHR